MPSPAARVQQSSDWWPRGCLPSLCPACESDGEQLQLPPRWVRADKEGAGAQRRRFLALAAEPGAQPGGTMPLDTIILSLRGALTGPCGNRDLSLSWPPSAPRRSYGPQ